jgi:glycine betaine/proline transport system ATP-binding protein
VMKQGKNIQCGTALDLLEAPADPYIEEFVAEVDRSRVLTAGMIARPTALHTTRTERVEILDSGSTRVSQDTVLHDLLPLLATGVEPVEVTDQHGAIIGKITAEDVFSALAPSKGNSNNAA